MTDALEQRDEVGGMTVADAEEACHWGRPYDDWRQEIAYFDTWDMARPGVYKRSQHGDYVLVACHRHVELVYTPAGGWFDVHSILGLEGRVCLEEGDKDDWLVETFITRDEQDDANLCLSITGGWGHDVETGRRDQFLAAYLLYQDVLNNFHLADPAIPDCLWHEDLPSPFITPGSCP